MADQASFFECVWYLNEREPIRTRRKCNTLAQHTYDLFVAQSGDMPFDELRHVKITEFMVSQLSRGLQTISVRLHFSMLNTMRNMAFNHLEIDRFIPFTRTYIRCEGELSLTMATITGEQFRMLWRPSSCTP